MKKYLFLMVLMAVATSSGCTMVDKIFNPSGSSWPNSAALPKQQLSDGKASFDQKIKNSAGLPLAQVQKDWGALAKGLSKDGLTVYTWKQTARLTTPDGEVKQAKGNQETTSCLAMFIVNNADVVMEATAEGQCFDYRLMPAWRPYIIESTDGRKGEVARP